MLMNVLGFIFSLKNPRRAAYSLLFNPMSSFIMCSLVVVTKNCRPFSLFIPLKRPHHHPDNQDAHKQLPMHIYMHNCRKSTTRTVSSGAPKPRICYYTPGQSALQMVGRVSTIDKGQCAGRAGRSISPPLIHMFENAKQVVIMGGTYKAWWTPKLKAAEMLGEGVGLFRFTEALFWRSDTNVQSYHGNLFWPVEERDTYILVQRHSLLTELQGDVTLSLPHPCSSMRLCHICHIAANFKPVQSWEGQRRKGYCSHTIEGWL